MDGNDFLRDLVFPQKIDRL